MGAVIDESSFATQRDAIAEASAAGAEIVAGGGTDDSEGWFVEPTVIKTDDPEFRLLRDELFGPVVTAYVYDESKWAETLDLVDSTGTYALTGAVFSNDRYAIDEAHEALRYAAGNFYVNDKPTGAVVGQQPFGGARASGTNDKAGSMWNLIRWVEPAHDQGDARAGDRLPLPVPAAGRMRRALPGLALAGAGVAVSLSAALGASARCPRSCSASGSASSSPTSCAFRSAAAPASGIAAGPVLKLGVVLLGLDLIFPDILALGLKALLVVVAVVAITFFGTRWAGRRLGISDDLSLLVATGFSICGVSAIAAADGVIEADEDEVAFAVALVTLCGTLAIVTLPPLRHPLGLDDEQFGAWVGASVHDVAQVVATSSTAGAVALATAVVVKLTRVMLLAPLIAGIALQRGRSARIRRPPTWIRRGRRSCRRSSSPSSP